VTQNLIGCLSTPGGTTIEANRDGLQAIAGQIEAELQQSEVYRQAVASLQALPEEVSKQAHMFLRAVSRTAIRLALRRFVRKNRTASDAEAAHLSEERVKPLVNSHLSAISGGSVSAPASENKNRNGGQSTSPASGTSASRMAEIETSATQSTPNGLANGPLHPSSSSQQKPKSEPFRLRKRNKPELSRQKIIQQREDLLRQLGQTIQEVRESKSVSLRQLHTTTLVPLHHLEALEMGRVDRLPEDVYLRGFIRRIGNALGLDGNHLAASLPKPENQDVILPSWYHPTTSKSSSLHLDSMHLYLGYAALMAGGFVWLSQQAPPKDSFQLDLNLPNESSVQPSPTSQISPLPAPARASSPAKNASTAKPSAATSSSPTTKNSSTAKASSIAPANPSSSVTAPKNGAASASSSATTKSIPTYKPGIAKSTATTNAATKATSVKAKPLAGAGIAPPETLSQPSSNR
jgi:cytoskeletal protein RodZ